MPGTAAVGRDITERPTWRFAHPEAQKKNYILKGNQKIYLGSPFTNIKVPVKQWGTTGTLSRSEALVSAIDYILPPP